MRHFQSALIAEALVDAGYLRISFDDRPTPATNLAAAKAFGTEAAVTACERSIQVHGGIGLTWEHPLHRFYKRALWLEGIGLRPAQLRRVVVANLLPA